MQKETIILASDHAGFELKEAIKGFLIEKGYEVDDVGAEVLVPDDDYPQYMAEAARMISMNLDKSLKAIIFGGSGQGEAMIANRFPGVRAAVWYGGNLEPVILSREHNDANVFSIGARMVSFEEASEAITTWLDTPFSGDERHKRRIDQIDSIE